MARLRFRGRDQSGSRTLMLLALGAVTGLALGVVLADRAGGVDGLKSKVREARRRRRLAREDAIAASLEEGVPSIADREVHALDETVTYPSVRQPMESELAHTGQYQSDHGPDDQELETRVLEAFKNDPTLRGRAIDIGAIGDGIIELTGWVHSPAEVGHALTLARGVPDVTHVMDRLTIRGTDFSRVGK